MATKKGSKLAKAAAKSRKRSAKRAGKGAVVSTGNAALDRANASAKKGGGLLKAVEKALTPAKVKKGARAVVKAIEGAIDATAKKSKPQFFGRKKVKKQLSPERQEALRKERNAIHLRMMELPWYAEHRTTSIELWVARRTAIADKDKAEVERINRKLEQINKTRDKARAAWKEAGGVVPALPKDGAKKAAKKSGSKKKAAPKKAGKKSDNPKIAKAKKVRRDGNKAKGKKRAPKSKLVMFEEQSVPVEPTTQGDAIPVESSRADLGVPTTGAEETAAG